MSRILIVPGLHGSGPEHWQSWFERKLPDTHRVKQEDWTDPKLPRWAGAVRREIAQASGPVWIVAHSFGCLATASAAVDFRDKIAGILFVAPADPDKFGVFEALPDERLEIPCVIVASSNDPWMRLTKAAYLADIWGARLINHGAVGHINVDSGFGPWPAGLEIFEQLRQSQSDLPLGAMEPELHPASRRISKQSRKKLAESWQNGLYGSKT